MAKKAVHSVLRAVWLAGLFGLSVVACGTDVVKQYCEKATSCEGGKVDECIKEMQRDADKAKERNCTMQFEADLMNKTDGTCENGRLKWPSQQAAVIGNRAQELYDQCMAGGATNTDLAHDVQPEIEPQVADDADLSAMPQDEAAVEE